MSPLEQIAVEGPALERGRRHGRARADDIRRFLGEGVARLEWVSGRPLDRAAVIDRVLAHARVIERRLPEIAEEIHGLADGAGIAVEDAYLLQCRREVASTGRGGDCTSMALSRPETIVAQTVDLPGGLSEFALALLSRHDGKASLQLTFAGLLGYVGINDRGLAVGLNMVVSDGWRPGVPPYLIVRHLLTLDSVAECLDELRRLPRASSRCYTLADPTEICQAETTCDEVEVLRSERLLHTNHYLSPALAARERAHVMTRRDSRRRLERAEREARRLWPQDAPAPAAASIDRLFELMAVHGDGAICVHGDGDPRRFETVAAVVLQPGRGRMLARRGPPCRADTSIFSIEGGAA